VRLSRAAPPPGAAPHGKLRGELGASHYFAFGFGSIVGSGWLVIVGGWLTLAGPLGTALGFALGGATIAIISICYARLAVEMPEAGGEFLYIGGVFGGLPGFMTGWFLTSYYVAVCVFEGLALAEVLRTVLPVLPASAAASARIAAPDLIAGGLGTAVIYGLNVAGIRISASFQWLANYGFLALATLVLIILTAHGAPAHLHPAFVTAHGSIWPGVLALATISIFMLDGFQAIPQAIEERAPGLSPATAARMIVVSVIVAALFYAFVALASAAVLPWRKVAGPGIATFKAASGLPGGWLLVRLLAFAAAISLLKTWNVVMIMTARLLFAMARAGMAPAILGRLSRSTGAPIPALSLVAGLTLLGLLLGRNAIDPIISLSAIVLGAVYLATCLALLFLRRRRAGRLQGAALPVAGSVAATLVLGIAMYQLVLGGADSAPVAGVLAVWSLLGLLVWRKAAGPGAREEQATSGQTQAEATQQLECAP
jgi:amino acid transporter